MRLYERIGWRAGESPRYRSGVAHVIPSRFGNLPLPQPEHV